MRVTGLAAVALMVAVLATPAVADEMQDAMARADALNLFRQINLRPAQARQMVAPLQRIRQIVEGYESQQEQALRRMAPNLRNARQKLIAGEALSADMVQTIEAYQEQREAARREVYRSVDAEMQAIAEVLEPAQNELLDWTAPASIRPRESLQERLRMQEIAMARIQEAAGMLDRVKHLDAFNFVTGRSPIINDYLSTYFRPDVQQYQQAYQIAIRYTDQVRMLTETEWQNQVLEISAALVDELGLMPRMDPGRRPGTVSWNTLFRLMTNPETPAVVRGMAG